MITTLLTYYNATEFPAVVIEEKVYQGHQDTDKLLGYICKEFLISEKRCRKNARIST